MHNHMRWLALYGIISFLILSLLALSGCENPGSFERGNPSDPDSKNFNRSENSDIKLQLQLININQIQVTWPKVFGVERYKLLRRLESDSFYSLIAEIENYRDTTFTDYVPEADSYYYRIDAISRKGGILTMKSDRILSNWIEGPALSFNNDQTRRYYISNGYSFAMKTAGDGILAHYLNQSDEIPVFSWFDLNSNDWDITTINNFGVISDVVRSRDLFSIDSRRFLAVKNNSVCDIEMASCSTIDAHRLLADGNIRDITYTRLNDSRVIVTGGVKTWTLIENFALIFDPSDNTITRVAAPKDMMLPSTLTTLPNGDVFSCELNEYRNVRSKCQIYDIQMNVWNDVSSYPLIQYESNSQLLDDGRVFFLSRLNEPVNNASIYDPEIDEWVITPQTSYSTGQIYYNSFRNPIHKRVNGNVLILTHSRRPNNINAIADYYIEEYEPGSDSWIKIYKLPDHINRVYNFTEIGTGRYFITYNEIYSQPRSAFFYLD